MKLKLTGSNEPKRSLLVKFQTTPRIRETLSKPPARPDTSLLPTVGVKRGNIAASSPQVKKIRTDKSPMGAVAEDEMPPLERIEQEVKKLRDEQQRSKAKEANMEVDIRRQHDTIKVQQAEITQLKRQVEIAGPTNRRILDLEKLSKEQVAEVKAKDQKIRELRQESSRLLADMVSRHLKEMKQLREQKVTAENERNQVRGILDNMRSVMKGLLELPG